LKKINIAIDGPAGAGKSTVARLLANKLGYIYVDTGAMYRAITWKVLQLDVSMQLHNQIVQIAKETTIEIIPDYNKQKVFVDHQEVTDMIRSAEVTSQVSIISQIPEIRSILVLKQKQLAQTKGVVMDGRDIGTMVLPDAELKIFLTADHERRAKRRYDEYQVKGEPITLDQLIQDMKHRDQMDEQREISPLICANDSIKVDSSELSIEEVVDCILELSRSILSKEPTI
jgi:cytidylate kinase